MKLIIIAFFIFQSLVYSNEHIIKMAQLSKLVYETNNLIEAHIDGITLLDETHKVKFILADNCIIVRGTANIENALQDLSYRKSYDKILKTYVHHGFSKDATYVFNKILPHLDKKVSYFVTGHSLGGAIAGLIACYLHEKGYKVESCITFGQPMFLNYDAAKKFEGKFPYLRVINHFDPVPMVPPATLISVLRGHYSHFGPQLVLKDGSVKFYTGESVLSVRDDLFFYKEIEEEKIHYHYMDNYLESLDNLKSILSSQ